MTRSYIQDLKMVTIVHIGIVVALTLVSCCRSFFAPKPEYIMPVELIQLPSPIVIHDPVINKSKVDRVAKPLPPKSKTAVKVSPKRVTQSLDNVAPAKQLTENEIKKLLSAGQAPRKKTETSNDDAVYLERIRMALYEVWAQPSREEVGNVVAEMQIRFESDGSLRERKLITKSGNSVMDASVEKAVRSVNRIDGLSPSFLERRKIITISFKVE
ncbi:MAG: TonB C-terminal domain-containing protein [Lentisphaerae bacterium]|nr:TonB C-terminal domain-containing protein [Lentisphaerota bacterium]